MKFIKKTLIILSVILALCIISVSAQEADRPRHRMREKVRDKMHLLKMWKMSEYLNLDDETSLKVFSVVKKYDEENMKLMKNSHDAVKEMKDGLKDNAFSDKQLDAMIKKIRFYAQKMHENIQDRIDELSKILTKEQLAKYIIFEMDFRREMAKITQRAMKGGRGREGKGRGID